MIRRSHPWFTPLKLSRFGFGFIVNATTCPQARSSSDEPNCANRVYCFAFARRNAQRCNTRRKEADESIESKRVQTMRVLVTFSEIQIGVPRYHPHKFPRQTGLGLPTALNTLTVRLARNRINACGAAKLCIKTANLMLCWSSCRHDRECLRLDIGYSRDAAQCLKERLFRGKLLPHRHRHRHRRIYIW